MENLGKAIITALICFIFVCFSGTVKGNEPLKSNKVINFAILYKKEKKREQYKYEKLREYLSKKGIIVNFEYYQNPNDISEVFDKMDKGEVDIAGEFSPFKYFHARKRVLPLVRSIYNGRDFYFSVIVARTNDTISNIADLEGKTIAFSNTQSTSGYIFPRSMIYEKNFDLKLRSEDLIKNKKNIIYYKFFGNHSNVLDALVSEEKEQDIIAGAMPDFFYKREAQANPLIKKLEMDGRSNPIKNGVFVFRKSLQNDEMISRLKETLIDLTENPPENFFDEWGGFQGWITWVDGDYDGLLNALKTPSPTEKAMRVYLLIIAIAMLLGSGLFFFNFLKKDVSS